MVIGDEACPSCRAKGRDSTGNHLMIFDNGTKYCNRCGHFEDNNNKPMSKKSNVTVLGKPTWECSVEEVRGNTTITDLPSRGISREIADRFGATTELDTAIREPINHFLPYYQGQNIVGYKVRPTKEKAFGAVGTLKDVDPFGFHLIGNGGKLLIITEGEYDAMAAAEIFRRQGKNYRVISLPNGASESGLKNRLETLDRFETIALAFDQDEQGQKAVERVSALFTPGKVKVMKFSEKDANDMLLAGKEKEFYQALANATAHRPDGIITGADTWDKIKDRPDPEYIPYPPDWELLNLKTYGMRIGELDTWTSGSGMGKTQVLRELQYHVLMSTDDNIGIIALEEPLVDSVESLMALHLNRRLQLPDIRSQITDEEKYEAWKATSGTNRIHYYDHFGSVDDDSLISKIRYMVRGLGCKRIFLDHLSIVVSEFADQGGERERIDSIMTRLKNLTQELNIWLGLVVHLRKVGGGTSFEEGGVPTLDDLRGSGSIKQLSNTVLALSRNQQHPDDDVRNTSTLHVLKCRFSGRTGQADQLFFNDETGRMVPVELPVVDEEDKDEF